MEDREQIFTLEDAWIGGYYELSIELGPTSPQRLKAALSVLGAHPDLDVFYREYDKEPWEQVRLLSAARQTGQSLYGVATLTDGFRLPCGVFPVDDCNGIDFLDIGLPLGSLGRKYPIGGYPFENQPKEILEAWQAPLDKWFREIGNYLYESVPFRLATIAFEVSGEMEAKDFSQSGIPEQRSFACLWPTGKGLQWYPANRRG